MINLVDNDATFETKALYYNLLKIRGKGILFGQQDATMYGINWKDNEDDRSDVKSVTGSHPAVYGWDLEHVVNQDAQSTNQSENIKKLAREAYNRGGINTLSWHMGNPLTGKNFYDTTKAVYSILPGGSKHEDYKRKLDTIANFISSLKGSDNKLIPVIFRPFHEHTGNWFWWGKPFCSPEEYISLWQFTVSYLRDTQKVRNVLYAYSPDKTSGLLTEYLERYPGDEYVDILGQDNYWEFRDIKYADMAVKGLAEICKYARSRNKVAALTETGMEKIENPAWFTEVVLNKIKADPDAREIAYLMVWRNAHTGHFYAPYPGHSSVPDFLKFYADPYTLFQNDIKNIYKTDKPITNL